MFKCPPGGTWKGSFDNDRRRREKVSERFVLYINSQVKVGPNGDLLKVEGSGSNKFGTFLLEGTFNPSTMALDCTRGYLPVGSKLPQVVIKALNVGNSSSRDDFSAVTSPQPTTNMMRTRKKLLSWQKGRDWDELTERPQSKKRKTPANKSAVKGGGGARGAAAADKASVSGVERNLYSVFSPAGASKKRGDSSSAPGSHFPLPRLQKNSKASTPSLPDPALCRWRSAFFFDAPINKEIYEGEMLNQQRDGRGVFLYKNGNT